MRDKWKEPILQNKEEQLAWTMAYTTQARLWTARSFHEWVALGMYANIKNYRNEKRLHSTTG